MSVQVAISADYFPAYARIPRKAQRKADEFIRKFREDPKQGSIHYEPIQGALDQQLRSVRIGDDYRAIVRAPERGDIFILLYVDHHDEAYRWAEGKQVAVHPTTGTLQVFDVDQASVAVSSVAATTGKDDEFDLEAVEKRLFSEFSDQALYVGGVPWALLPAVRALFTDADLDKLVPHLPREAADLLTGLAAGYGYDELLESILATPVTLPLAEGVAAEAEAADILPAPASRRVPSEPPAVAPSAVAGAAIDPGDIAAALQRERSQEQFRLLDTTFDLDRALAYPLDVWRVYLHPSQRAIVRARTKGPMRVTGVAGTGKTVVAMHRTAFLLRDVFKAPDDKVLVTTFTRNLAVDIRNNLAKLLDPEDMTRVEVTSIDAWAADYLAKVGKAARPATNEVRNRFWERAFDLYGVDGYDVQFCKTEWEVVVQGQGIIDEATYVSAVRHHRGASLARADRRKLWQVFQEYRNALDAAGVAEWLDILRAARAALDASAPAGLYCSVIVDEVQDFSGEALRLVRSIAGPERANDLMLVGDAHQRIYGRPIPLGQCGINVRGRRSRELRLNYRTTSAICRWSIGTLGGESYDDLDGGTSRTRGIVSLRKGEPPMSRHFDDAATEREYVVDSVDALLKGGVLPEEICLVARSKRLLEGYGRAFERAGIDAEVLEQRAPRTSSIRLATMHRVKGLEFPIVFVCGVNDGIVPLSTPDLSSDDPLVAEVAERQERSLLYVAASRARDRLFVTSYGVRSPFLEGIASTDLDQKSAEVPTAPNPVTRVLGATQPQVSSGSSLGAQTRAESGSGAFDSSSPSQLFSDPTPLDGWNLGTRMQNWLDRHAIATVGQLLALDPAAVLKEKNLGRKSVADADQEIQERLGASWRELHARGIGSAGVALSGLGHAELRELASVLDTPLSRLPFPARFVSWASRNQVSTLRELVARSPLALMEEKNVGRSTVARARAIVQTQTGRRWEELKRALAGGLPEMSPEERAVAEAATRERLWSEGLLPSLKSMFVDLETIPRMIVTRRAGLGSEAESLDSIGSTLGVTRERVRQVEKKVWDRIVGMHGFVEYVEGQCRRVASDGAVALESLESYAWWRGLADAPEALDYFLDKLLDGRWGVVILGENGFLAEGGQRELDAAFSSARRTAKALGYPSPIDVVRQAVDTASQSLVPGLRAVVWDTIEEELSLDGEGAGQRALSFGGTKNAQILAFLERQGAPVHIGAVTEVLGRFGALPPEVFLLGRGTIGLERHFPDFQRWRGEVAPIAIRSIEESGPERQWSCRELLNELQDRVYLPEWLDHWHLAEILKRSEGIEYLGRLRVALPGAVDDSTRIHAHDEVERILQEAGEPLAKDEIARRLRRKLDVSDVGFAGILNRSLFVRVDRERWGLLSRDLPGGIERLSEALDELEGVLERRQRGLSGRFIRRELANLSPVHAMWTEEMCVSVVRGDPRFRLSMSSAVGLAAWDDVRVPSRVELVRDALALSGDRVSIKALQDRIAALYEEAPDRTTLGAMSNRFGWRLDGDDVVRGSES